MQRVFIAATRAEERSALHLLLYDMSMQVVGQASDWATTLAQAPLSGMELLVIDWDLIPGCVSTTLESLRAACPATVSIILVSRLDPFRQAAVSSGANAFISKSESPERVAHRFRSAVQANMEAQEPELY